MVAAKTPASAADKPAEGVAGGATVSVHAAATALGISKAHAYNLIREGSFPLPTIRIGVSDLEGRRRSRLRVSAAALAQLLEGGGGAAEPPPSRSALHRALQEILPSIIADLLPGAVTVALQRSLAERGEAGAL